MNKYIQGFQLFIANIFLLLSLDHTQNTTIGEEKTIDEEEVTSLPPCRIRRALDDAKQPAGKPLILRVFLLRLFAQSIHLVLLRDFRFRDFSINIFQGLFDDLGFILVSVFPQVIIQYNYLEYFHLLFYLEYLLRVFIQYLLKHFSINIFLGFI